MEDVASQSKVAMYVTQGSLVVPLQVELDDELVLQVQEDILERVNRTGVRGIIIDVSGVAIIDSSLGRTISDTARMASLLGARTVVTSLRPGVAASLVDLDFEMKDVLTAVSTEEGFRILAQVIVPEEEREEADETEEEIEAPEEEAEESEHDETDEDDEDE